MPTATAREVETLARLAFEAHREVHVLGVAVGVEQHAERKPWADLPALEQEAWRAAARAIIRALK